MQRWLPQSSFAGQRWGRRQASPLLPAHGECCEHQGLHMWQDNRDL